MTSVAILSVQGAPGVSTMVAAMAAAADGPLLAVEAAPTGGVVAARWGWPRTRTVAELALDGSTVDLWQAARPWIETSKILPGDPSAVVMRQAQPGRWLAEALASSRQQVVVDAGRVDGSADQLELLSAVDRRWLLVDPMVDQVIAARALTGWLRRAGPLALLVREHVPGDGHHRPAEVASALGLPLQATVPLDRPSAEALCGTSPPRRGMRQSPLLRTAHQLTTALADAEEVPA